MFTYLVHVWNYKLHRDEEHIVNSGRGIDAIEKFNLLKRLWPNHYGQCEIRGIRQIA